MLTFNSGNSRSPAWVKWLSYGLPITVALAIIAGVLKNDYVVGMSWEFVEYGSIGENILAGKGSLSGAFLPYDLSLLRHRDPRPSPPLATCNRTLLPGWLTAIAIRVLGPTDIAVMMPHITAVLVLVLMTHHLQRRFMPAMDAPVASMLVACSPTIFISALECYPNVLFAVLFIPFLLLSYHIAYHRGNWHVALAAGLFAGLAQLTRSEFVLCLPVIMVFIWIPSRSRQAVRSILIVGLLFAVLASFEILFVRKHVGASGRSEAFWLGLANHLYGLSWLHYIQIDRLELLRAYGPSILERAIMNFPAHARGVVFAVIGHPLPWLKAIAGLFMVVGFVCSTVYAREQRRMVALLAVCLVGMLFLVLFGITGPGAVRYLAWIIPFFAILIGAGLSAIARVIAVLQRQIAASAIREVLAWLVVLAVGGASLTKVAACTTNFYEVSPTWFFSDIPHRDVLNMLRQSRDENYPALREMVSPEALIVTDEPAVHRYAQRFVMYLPMSRESFDAIEKEWFSLPYIYLGPILWQNTAEPLLEYYRHYIADEQGVVPMEREAKVGNFLKKFPGYVVAHEFSNGGILFIKSHGQ